MKIIHVPRRFVTSDWGGTETVVLEISKSMNRASHRSEVWCPSIFSSPGPDQIEGVPVRRFSYTYPYWGLTPQNRRRLDQKGGNLFSLGLWRALARQPELDIVHLHTGNRLGGVIRTVARSRRIPYVVTLHGGVCDVPASEAASFTEPTKGTFEWGKALGWLVGSRRTLRDAAMLLCVGRQEARRVAEKFPDKRVEYVPNGVNSARFESGDGPSFRRRHGIPSDRKVVLVVGRVDPQKNQLFLLGQLKELLRRDPKIYLLFIGPSTNDKYADELRAQIGSDALRGHVQWLPGFAPGSGELVDAYHAANLFALPSVHEPFGIVILEAWCAGCPVVSSAVGGIPGFVEHQVDALLVPIGDGPRWVDAICAVLQNRSLAAALSFAGKRKAIEEYSWDSVTAKLLKLYEVALRENPLC